MEKKACTKCNKEKNLTEYHKAGNGHRPDCKECACAQKKKYYQENPEKERSRKKKYRQENPDKKKASNKKWRQENPDKKKASNKKWKQENPEKVRASRRLSDAKRRAQKINTQVEEFTTEQLNEYWVKNNIDPEKCYHCGEAPYEHLDHYMPYARGGGDTKDNLVPSCAHCNLSKGSKTPDEWDKYRGL